MNQTQAEALRRIIDYEEANPPEEHSLGWTWSDVRVHASTLNALVLQEIIDIAFKSNSMTGYRLTEKGKAQNNASASSDALPEDNEPVELPDDLFGPIVGHDDVKRLTRAALKASKPVHVLLLGPPALSKSLFLWDIERVYGQRALWVIGSALSQAGLWDLINERRPDVLLIDELDKLRGPDQAALLSLMEGGRLVRAKAGGRALDLAIEAKVIAAANRTDGLSQELLSRFAIRHLRAYSSAEFRQVVEGVLVSREEVSEEVAKDVAAALQGVTQDVRDAIRVARLTGELSVDEAIELLGLRVTIGHQRELSG